MRSTIAVVFSICFTCPCLAAEFHVSVIGNDAWSGSIAAPNATGTDGPFRTLAGARDAVRRQRSHVRQQAVEPVTVTLHRGTYFLDQTFELTQEDGGSAGAEVTWRAAPGETVRLTGGRELIRWFRVDDAEVRNRIQPEWRDKIRQASLPLHGVTEFGKLSAIGFGRKIQVAPVELFFAGQRMTLARWPNHAWAAMTSAPDGQQGRKFTCAEAPMNRWRTAEDLWVHGFWSYDWADTFEKVARVDPQKKELTTAATGVYGYTAGKRFYAVNLIEELDEPGEYWIDRISGKIYFWCPASLDTNEAWVSVLQEPLLKLVNTRYLRIEGLTLECGRGAGAVVDGGEHNRFSACTFRNLGTFAVSIGGECDDVMGQVYANVLMQRRSGHDNAIIDCDIYNCGEGGVLLGGGDRRTLAPGNNSVEQCRIHDYQQRTLTYRGGITIDGVGNRVVHNAIYDAPHTAIFAWGNDHLVEYNDIHNVCTDTGDAGAFYIGRDLAQRGTLVRFNRFRDIRGVKGQKGFTDVMGVYLDDCACGVTIFGNIFQNVSRGILVGGGRDNTIDNNIFVDCPKAIHIDARATSWAHKYWTGEDNVLKDRLKAVHHDQPPYRERYPLLARVLEDEPALPKGNRVEHNIASGCGKWIEFHDKFDHGIVRVEDNFNGPDAGFVNATAGRFDLKPGAPAAGVKFEPIPTEKIGPARRSDDNARKRSTTIDPSAPPD